MLEYTKDTVSCSIELSSALGMAWRSVKSTGLCYEYLLVMHLNVSVLCEVTIKTYSKHLQDSVGIQNGHPYLRQTTLIMTQMSSKQSIIIRYSK